MFNKAMLTVEVSWWSKGTVMERRMVVLAGLMFLLSLSLIAVLVVFREDQVDQYCFTKECVTAAADILNRMNSSADPCQDFYNFACGGFIENTVIPHDRSITSMLSELSDQLDQKVWVVFWKKIQISILTLCCRSESCWRKSSKRRTRSLSRW